MLQSEATPGEDEMNPTVKRSGWHPPEDTGLWAIADRIAVEVHPTIRSSDSAFPAVYLPCTVSLTRGRDQQSRNHNVTRPATTFVSIVPLLINMHGAFACPCDLKACNLMQQPTHGLHSSTCCLVCWLILLNHGKP